MTALERHTGADGGCGSESALACESSTVRAVEYRRDQASGWVLDSTRGSEYSAAEACRAMTREPTSTTKIRALDSVIVLVPSISMASSTRTKCAPVAGYGTLPTPCSPPVCSNSIDLEQGFDVKLKTARNSALMLRGVESGSVLSTW